MAVSETLEALKTIRDFIRWGSSEFSRRNLTFGHGFTSAIDEAKYLTLHTLALPYDWPESYFDCALTAEERERVTEILELRARLRQPAAYITHESWFCGLKFYVDERVLVPRSPIAELISNQFEPWIDSAKVSRILDLCTGSGCIAIACQYAFADAEVCASDISLDALEVARINCRNHDLKDQLTLYESDLLEHIPPQLFDVIVCNPPYVDAEDMAALTDEFRFEPTIGLAAGNNGLALVERILFRVGKFLSEQGVLFIELGNSQHAMMEKYSFLPMTWLEFEFGGSGVCCIHAEDIKQQYENIVQITNQPAVA